MNIVKSLEEYGHLAIVRKVKTELERRLITVPSPEDSCEKDTGHVSNSCGFPGTRECSVRFCCYFL